MYDWRRPKIWRKEEWKLIEYLISVLNQSGLSATSVRHKGTISTHGMYLEFCASMPPTCQVTLICVSGLSMHQWPSRRVLESPQGRQRNYWHFRGATGYQIAPLRAPAEPFYPRLLPVRHIWRSGMTERFLHQDFHEPSSNILLSRWFLLLS